MTGINRARIQQEDHNDSQLVSYKMANETEGKREKKRGIRLPPEIPLHLCSLYTHRVRRLRTLYYTPDIEFIFISSYPNLFQTSNAD